MLNLSSLHVTHVTANILLWTCLHIYHWMCMLRILQNLNSNMINIMFTHQYSFTNSSSPWRTALWSLWKCIMQYTGLLFHISYNTFFYNTLHLATSIFKWWFWFFISFFLSWFHNMNIVPRYYKVSGYCHQLAYNKEHSIETIPVPVFIWKSRDSCTWLGLTAKANLNHW